MAALHASLRCVAASPAPARRAARPCGAPPLPRRAAPRRLPRAPAAAGGESLEALARQLSSAQPVRRRGVARFSQPQLD